MEQDSHHQTGEMLQRSSDTLKHSENRTGENSILRPLEKFFEELLHQPVSHPIVLEVQVQTLSKCLKKNE